MIFHSPATEAASGGIPERSGTPVEAQWNLAVLFADADAWEEAFQTLEAAVAPLEAMKGTLHSEENVLAFLRKDTELDRLAERIYVYAHLKADEDTRDTTNQARENRIRATFAQLSERLAWSQPELLANDLEVLQGWVKSDTLSEYRYALQCLIRRKEHTLSPAEEALLAGAGVIFSAPGEAYNLLTNADLAFPSVADAGGAERELSQGRFLRFMEDRDRGTRQRAFEGLYDTYKGVLNTVTCTLRTHVKMHNYLARVRHFDSALAGALHPDQVPVTLYEALIAANHEALPAFHAYLDLRRQMLGVDTLDMFDMYVPIVPEIEVKVPFEQAREWILAACAPLGEEYLAVLRTAFEQGWIDLNENRGKRSGAYSSGCYDSLPYILMNYQGTLNDVFTLAHELGHSMHSWLANHAQPPQTAGYPIFIAEIASTANEALLLDWLLREKRGDAAFSAYLLNHYCDGFRGTVYRQTMFGEFEKMVHELDAAGTPLSPDGLGDQYYELNATYHGPAVQADRRISWEWARIPHFYYNFYVYKYSTSFCASQIFAERILAGDTEARDRLLGLLRAGGSADPLDLVREAGVDLCDPETFRLAFARFGRTVTQLAELLLG
jgi:oligoendopeptidase F